MLQKKLSAKSCLELLEEFRQLNPLPLGKKILFSGVGERDVYNISAPFLDEGELVIAGRVEARNVEQSEVVFFVSHDGSWVPRENTRTFPLQDPFFSWIKGELVVGGVEVYFDPHNPEVITSWKTLFYRGSCIGDLQWFASGQKNMKDIRLVELADGKIGMFTRPLGLPNAKALIGFSIIASLDEVLEETMDKVELFHDQFVRDEWGGPNEIHLLKNGILGVLGHIAYMDAQGGLHYHATTFAYNPDNGLRTPIKIIAVRDNFPDGVAKRPSVKDVIFSGGLQRQGNGTAILYVGVSDAEAQQIELPDPFLEYETN